MIRASVYYQYWDTDIIKVWIHVGQLGHPDTIVSGPTSYTKKDFARLMGSLPELKWEELGKRIEMRD